MVMGLVFKENEYETEEEENHFFCHHSHGKCVFRAKSRLKTRLSFLIKSHLQKKEYKSNE